MAQLAAGDDQHRQIRRRRGAQFPRQRLGRDQGGRMLGRPCGERVGAGRARARQDAGGEIGLQLVELVDHRLDGKLLPCRLGRQAARGGAHLVEGQAGAGAVINPGRALDRLSGALGQRGDFDGRGEKRQRPDLRRERLGHAGLEEAGAARGGDGALAGRQHLCKRGRKPPLLLFSSAGGGDIEEVSAESPEKIHRVAVDIRTGLPPGRAEAMLTDAGIAEPARREVAAVLDRLYGLYRQIDADLVEVNPLAVTTDGRVVALDSKISIDAGAQARQPALREIVGDRVAADDTPLERSGRDLGMQFIELDGEVGVLANGAGLTMTTLDAINHYGGRPANFLEIGGDAYTKATPALRLVLANPKVRSLLVNFCGAFARTDVMTEGVVQAWEELKPDVPVFFSIHGTGEEEAIALVRERLGMEPYDLMDDAVRAAVEAAGTGTGTGTANVAASGVAR